MEPIKDDRPVTRLGLWLTGSWPDSAPSGATERVRSAGRPVRADRDRPTVLDQVAALAGLAEVSGFDSLWVTDRVLGTEDRRSSPADPEAYSLLGALATRTEVVRLGAVPMGVDGRPPSIVAKIVTGIDVISHGRAVLTFGLAPADAVGGARATEALRVGRSMLEDEVPAFEGEFYTVEGAINQPSPVQAGGVPVVVFVEGFPDRSEVAVTEFIGLADAVIVGGGPGDVRRVVDEVRAVSRGRRAGPGDGVGSIQVIGIGLLPGMRPIPHPGTLPTEGSTPPPVDAEVGDLFAAGVDGCLVPMDLATPVEVLADLSNGLGDLSVH